VGGGALKNASVGKSVSVITNRRFSGFLKIGPRNTQDLQRQPGELRRTDPKTIVRSARGWGIDMVDIGTRGARFPRHTRRSGQRGRPLHRCQPEHISHRTCQSKPQTLQWRTISQTKISFEPSRTQETTSGYIRKNMTRSWLQNIVIKACTSIGGKGVKLIEDRQIYLHNERNVSRSLLRLSPGSMSVYSDVQDKIMSRRKPGVQSTPACFTDGKTVLGHYLSFQTYKSAHELDSADQRRLECAASQDLT